MTSPHVFVGVTSRPYTNAPIEWSGWGVGNNYVSLDLGSNQATYGELMLPGATLGVLLDMNKGSISFLRFGDSMCKSCNMLSLTILFIRLTIPNVCADGDSIVVKDLGPAFYSLRSGGKRHQSDEDGNSRGSYSFFRSQSSNNNTESGTNDDENEDDGALAVYPCFCLRSRNESVSLCASFASEHIDMASSSRGDYLLEQIMKSKQLLKSWKHLYNNMSVSLSQLSPLLAQGYKEFVRIRCLPNHIKTVRTRANIETVISISPTDMFETTKSLPKGPLRVGSILFLRSDRGNESKLIVVGVNPARTQVWYSLENDTTCTAWYFDVQVLTELFLRIIAGDLSGVGLMEDTQDSTIADADAQEALKAESEVEPALPAGVGKMERMRSISDGLDLSIMAGEMQQLSFEQYKQLIIRPTAKWAPSQDVLIVDVINACATRLDTSPLFICADQLLKERSTSKRRQQQQLALLQSHSHTSGVSVGISDDDVESNEDSIFYQRSLLDLMVRYSLLIVLNRDATNVLPYTDLDPLALTRAPAQAVGAGWCEGALTTMEQAVCDHYPHSRLLPTLRTNTQTHTHPYTQQHLAPFPSTSGHLFAQLKHLVFTRTKLNYWRQMIAHTTTPCSLPSEFGEMPRDIVDLKIDRELALRALATVKANNSNNALLAPSDSNADTGATAASAPLSFSSRLNQSLFGQMLLHFNNKSYNSTNSRALRRSYVGDLDAGQQRAFRIDEKGAIDSGGPYRAFFEHALGEEVTTLLQLFIPCANSVDARGLNQDKVVINTEGTLSTSKTSSSDLFTHVGALAGVCVRHGLFVPLSLPELILNPFTRTAMSAADVLSLDASLSSIVKRIVLHSQQLTGTGNNERLATPLVVENAPTSTPSRLTTVQVLSRTSTGAANVNETSSRPSIDANKLIALRSDLMRLLTSEGISGKMASKLVRKALIDVLTATKLESAPQTTVNDLLELVFQRRLSRQIPALRHMLYGLSLPLPVQLFPMFNSTELDVLLCGNPDFNVDVLKQATKYVDVLPTNRHIVLFWHVLEHEFNAAERSAFANFCCARSRLPSSAR
jgi:hypothetical protein